MKYIHCGERIRVSNVTHRFRKPEQWNTWHGFTILPEGHEILWAVVEAWKKEKAVEEVLRYGKVSSNFS